MEIFVAILAFVLRETAMLNLTSSPIFKKTRGSPKLRGPKPNVSVEHKINSK